MGLMGRLRESGSRVYHANRARAGAIPSSQEIATREALTRDAEQLRRHQAQRLTSLLTHAAETVPFYHERLAGHSLHVNGSAPVNLLELLPILEKDDIRRAGDALVSPAVPADQRYRNASGGSTGTPLQFYQDQEYLLEGKRATVQYDMWTGWRRGESVALLWGAPTDIARYGLFRERIRHVLQNRFLVDAFDMSEEKLASAARKLQEREPKLVIAYSSAAFLVARYLQERGVQIRHAPRGVIASAEVLWPHYRTAIEQAFGCRVFNRYGSREVGLIAMECPYGRMHINTLDLLVEVDKPGPDGAGDLLVTQLNNRVFPFIRYRIGDVGAVCHEKCECGRVLPVLRHLRGRTTDYIAAPDGTRIHGEWFTHLFYEVPGVRLFTFRQTTADTYVFDVQKSGGFDERAFHEAIEKARGRLGPRARLEVTFVERFEASPSGKHRFVWNEYITQDQWVAPAEKNHGS